MGHERTEQFLEILEMTSGPWYIFINSTQSSTLEFERVWSEKKFWKINMEIRLIT